VVVLIWYNKGWDELQDFRNALDREQKYDDGSDWGVERANVLRPRVLKQLEYLEGRGWKPVVDLVRKMLRFEPGKEGRVTAKEVVDDVEAWK
jgi:hypothetical protein